MMENLSLTDFRSRFPILATKTYLNSCSQGALSFDVEQAMASFIDSWHALGSPWDRWVEHVQGLRAGFARLIGAEADEVAIMPSASAGINAIASALRFDGRRTRVVAGDFEFPTMGQIWLAQQPRGAQVSWAKAIGDELPLASFEQTIDERTLVVAATRVCYKNGFLTDIAALSRMCRDRGAYLFLDDYQWTGSGPTSVKELGVDFMVTGCLKYLLGPSGVAFLYVRRELIERLEPAITGWFGRANPFEYRHDRLDWSPTARRFETGTPPVPNAYGALAGIELLQRVGFEAVQRQIATLTESCVNRAHDVGYGVATPRDARRRGPLVVLRSTNAQELVARLQKEDIITSARGNGIRLAFHAYNTNEDLERVFTALDAARTLLEHARERKGVAEHA